MQKEWSSQTLKVCASNLPASSSLSSNRSFLSLQYHASPSFLLASFGSICLLFSYTWAPTKTGSLFFSSKTEIFLHFQWKSVCIHFFISYSCNLIFKMLSFSYTLWNSALIYQFEVMYIQKIKKKNIPVKEENNTIFE